MYPKELKIYVHTPTENSCTSMFIAVFFMTAKRRKKLICPSTVVHKMWFIHIMKHYMVIKKNEVLIYASTWMNTENIILHERS